MKVLLYHYSVSLLSTKGNVEQKNELRRHSRYVTDWLMSQREYKKLIAHVRLQGLRSTVDPTEPACDHDIQTF